MPLSARRLFRFGGDPMNTQDFKRKLTAILSADVAGYSRLMGDDERATVETITTYRSDHDGPHSGSPWSGGGLPRGTMCWRNFQAWWMRSSAAVEIQKELAGEERRPSREPPDGLPNRDQPGRCHRGGRHRSTVTA